ncbi:hypothetical protein [Iningainema tapete]|uniref:Uncharacterized protein n=1 Tax=Iningainema tapete BLCC-T55 TaxID=2748662 RepID=A0A8J6XIP9_9CYAN|nr:hypothetical protein [Iningainema tapete]MBD2770962.1 hypothetical protein [Iningainema tapete BLCC-T55]
MTPDEIKHTLNQIASNLIHILESDARQQILEVSDCGELEIMLDNASQITTQLKLKVSRSLKKELHLERGEVVCLGSIYQ